MLSGKGKKEAMLVKILTLPCFAPSLESEILFCYNSFFMLEESFTNISSLRRHRNSRWLPFCRAAASALKRPRIVRVYDSESAQDAIDRINEMMGDGTNRGVPPRAALNPYLQPRDEVGGVQSQPKLYTQFTTSLHTVYTTFDSGLHMFAQFEICLYIVYIKFY